MPNITLKNAVLYKELSIKAKRKHMAVTIFILNCVLSVVALFILLMNNSQLANYESMDIQIFTWLFDAFIIIECMLICVSIPSETGPSISNERERQTLDVLLTTNMSNLDIILGKFLASVAYMLIFIVSTLPFLAVTLIFGSISFWQLLAVILAVIATAMYLSTFGIYFSTLVKKSSRAVALNLIVIFFIILGTIFFVIITKVISLAIAASATNGTFASSLDGDWSIFILYLNPATTVYDVLDKLVGLNLFDGTYRGMAGLFSNITSISPSNFFIKHWAPIGFTLQLLAGIGILKAAACSLNRTTRKYKGGKKTDH